MACLAQLAAAELENQVVFTRKKVRYENCNVSRVSHRCADTRTYSSSASIVSALSITCVGLCVCVWQPGSIMANAHSEFPIKSAQTALFVWRLCTVFILLLLSSSSCCHFYLAYSSILFWFTSPTALTRSASGILMAFANYSWNQKEKGKKQTKKQNEKASAENV